MGLVGWVAGATEREAERWVAVTVGGAWVVAAVGGRRAVRSVAVVQVAVVTVGSTVGEVTAAAGRAVVATGRAVGRVVGRRAVDRKVAVLVAVEAMVWEVKVVDAAVDAVAIREDMVVPLGLAQLEACVVVEIMVVVAMEAVKVDIWVVVLMEVE